MRIRSLIRSVLASCPGINHLFYRYYVYANGLNEKTIRGRLQQIGHAIDLRMRSGQQIPRALMKDFQFVLARAFEQKLTIDEAMLWALKMYYIARHDYSTICDEQEEDSPQQGTSDLAMPLENAIRNRRSVRRWTDDPVDMDEINKIIDLAKWAPSSCNRQQWQVLLLKDQNDIRFITEFSSSQFYKNVPLVMVVIMNTTMYGDYERHYAYLDGAAFIQNLLLGLHAMNYGACWIGFAKWNSYNDSIGVEPAKRDEFYKRFNLDSVQVPISIIPVGHPAVTPHTPLRQSIDSIVINPNKDC